MSQESFLANFSLFQHAEKRSVCAAGFSSPRSGRDRQQASFLNSDRDMYVGLLSPKPDGREGSGRERIKPVFKAERRIGKIRKIGIE